jgi:hypothetical protein
VKKLTPRQKELLANTVVRGGANSKALTFGSYWRTFDQLEKRKLLEYAGYGKYTITDAGREALAQSS